MSKSDDLCRKCKFWNEWGLPIIMVLAFGLATLGFYTFKFSNDNNACLEVFNKTNLENKELKSNLTRLQILSQTEMTTEAIFTPDNYFKFCQSKGYENGAITTYTCNGVICVTQKTENKQFTTSSQCYPIPEFIEAITK